MKRQNPKDYVTMKIKFVNNWSYVLVIFMSGYIESEVISKFDKVVPPLFVDLENHFLKAVWTENVMQCALRCNTNSGCQSFLYSNTGMSRKGYYEENKNVYMAVVVVFIFLSFK